MPAGVKIAEKVRKNFRDFLKKENYRITEERFKVLDEIISSKGHFEADELYLRLKSKGEKVSRATVYNTLELLFKSGLISRHKVGNTFVYEMAFGREHHDHLICLECGSIIEFRSDEIEAIQEEICKRYNFKHIRHTHQIYGICSKCLRKRT